MVTLVDYQMWRSLYTGSSTPAGALGDYDADGDVDLADFAAMQECIPTPPERAFPCITKFDYDGNQVVDLNDFAQFVSAFAEPSP